MAAIYRFGFEGGNIPFGTAFSGSYDFVTGRSGTDSIAATGTGSSPSYLVADSKDMSNDVYIGYHLRILNYNLGSEVSLIKFGPAELTYTAASSLLSLKSNGSVLATLVQALPTSIFIPINVKFVLDQSSGSLLFQIDNVSSEFVGDTLQGSSDRHPESIVFGLGSTTNEPKLAIDDISINNGLSYSNSSGSYGLSDTSFPPFIRATRTLLSGSGELSEWTKIDSYLTSSVIDIVNGVVDSFITANTFNKISQFYPEPIDSSSIVSFEGTNIYFKESYVLDNTSYVYLNGFLQISGSSSFNQSHATRMKTMPETSQYTVLEKDSGGKLSVDEFNNSYVTIIPRKFSNLNFFGFGLDGSAAYSINHQLPTPTTDFQIYEFQNLHIASGSILTTSNKNKGLVIYVRENCIIEGSLSMDGKGGTGSLSDSPTEVWKNVSTPISYQFAELATGSTWENETLYQMYNNGTSSKFEVSTWASGGLQGQNGEDGVFGGGGGAGIVDGAYSGIGGSSSFYSGGSGGGGGVSRSLFANGGDAVDYAGGGGPVGPVDLYTGGGGAGSGLGGGSIWLFVGKNLVLGSEGKITAVGGAGGDAIPGLTPTPAAGGGGAGGGNINVFYGGNFYNLGGQILVHGGSGGSGIFGGGDGGAGGSGSYQIMKVLSN